MARNTEKICYKRNYLSQVIARIDFLSPIKILETELPSVIGNTAKINFPIAEPTETISHELKIGPKNNLKNKTRKKTKWQFFGKNREKSCSITADCIFTNYMTYVNYESMISEFQSISDVLFKTFKDLQPKRLGLRYINNILLNSSKSSSSPLDWNGLINNKLISLFKFPSSDYVLSKAFHNLEFVFDDFNLRFQFGMPNPDHPSPIKKKLFVLDFDAYSQIVSEKSDIANTFDLFHSHIQSLFEKSIAKDLRGLMNAK